MGLLDKLLGKVYNIDLDSVFSYKTPKVVVIKDRYVGGLRVLVLIGIALYFVISSMVINQAYMVFEDVTSLIHMSHYFYATPKELPPYCIGGPNLSDVPQLPCQTFPNEWKGASSTSSHRKMFLTLPFGPIVQDGLFVTTAISPASFASPSTNLTDPNPNLTNAVDRYTLTPEVGYTKIYWAAQAGSLWLAEMKAGGKKADLFRARSSAALNMKLLDASGNVIVDNIDGSDGSYNFNTTDLLKSAGIDPDRMQTQWTKTTAVSLRYGGFSLSMHIKCTTSRDGGFKDCTANCVFDDIIQTFFVPPYPEIGINRTEYRRGFLLKVSVAGSMGRWSWPAFMLAWVSCTAMFGISTILTDFVLANMLPLSHIYNRMTTEETCDFSDFKKADPKAVEAVRAIRIAAYSKKFGMKRAEQLAMEEEEEEKEFMARNKGRCCLSTCLPFWRAADRVSGRMSTNHNHAKMLQEMQKAVEEEQKNGTVADDCMEVVLLDEHGKEQLGTSTNQELLARIQKLEQALAQKEMMEVLTKPSIGLCLKQEQHHLDAVQQVPHVVEQHHRHPEPEPVMAAVASAIPLGADAFDDDVHEEAHRASHDGIAEHAGPAASEKGAVAKPKKKTQKKSMAPA